MGARAYLLPQLPHGQCAAPTCSSDGTGITHITIGTGGNAADILPQTNASKAWTRYTGVGRNSVYEYLRMTPRNRSALDVEYVATQRNGANGTQNVVPYMRDASVLTP